MYVFFKFAQQPSNHVVPFSNLISSLLTICDIDGGGGGGGAEMGGDGGDTAICSAAGISMLGGNSIG